MNTKYQYFNVSKEEGVYWVEISREEKLNALNSDLLLEWRQLLTSLKEEIIDTDLGVTFLGAGEKAFIAGADIKGMSKMTKDDGGVFCRLGQEITLLIENFPLPTVAAVNGFALGGGCEMAMSCDFIYATNSSLFGQPEGRLGLLPGFGGTQRLPRYIGQARAKELIYSGRNFSAEKAHLWGLVNSLFSSKQEMIEGVKGFFKEVSKTSQLSVRNSKVLIGESRTLSHASGLELESTYFEEMFTSSDFKEGTAAFVEKRKANFIGK